MRTSPAPTVDRSQTGKELFIALAVSIWLGVMINLPTGLLNPPLVMAIAGTCCVLIWLLSNRLIAKQKLHRAGVFLNLTWFLVAVAITASLGRILAEAGVPRDALGPIHWVVVSGICAAYYSRFSTPDGSAAKLAVLASLYLLIVELIPADGLRSLSVVGAVIFIAAVWLDLKDPSRTGRRSRVASWLHVCAAPALLFPLEILMIITHTTAEDNFLIPWLVWSSPFVLAALLIDRRAYLVVILFTAFIIGYSNIKPMLSSGQRTTQAVAISLAALVLVFLWPPLRRWVMTRIPDFPGKTALPTWN